MLTLKNVLTICFLASAILQIILAANVVINKDFATYEEVKDLPNNPEKYLIDVRSTDLIDKDGSIPCSIDIPFTELEDALKMSDNEFLEIYAASKPPKDAVVIFTCLGGQYAQMGADLAKKLGWKCAKPYLGSWLEWSRREANKSITH